jgi:hypothetical protein
MSAWKTWNVFFFVPITVQKIRIAPAAINFFELKSGWTVDSVRTAFHINDGVCDVGKRKGPTLITWGRKG